jgi:predicted metal-dependent HD superfamily phosphohydrolase
MKQTFITQVVKYCNNTALAESLWEKLETAYTNEERHFHNLLHLEHLLTELFPLKTEIRDWDTLFFSLLYHHAEYDVVQNMVQADNEERSAALAEKDLSVIGFPEEKIRKCKEQILATKMHLLSTDGDTNLFSDADLSILGSNWEDYNSYKNNIRKEFDVYPDHIYHAGRLKVLEYFLNMPRIYKTEHFYNLYERQARENIAEEIELLSLL